MPRYACLIHYDPHVLFGGSPEANAALAECEGYDEVLKAQGAFLLGEALELPETAMTVRVRDNAMSTTDGPFMESREMLGGIVLVEAADLNAALRLAAGTPARAGRRHRGAPLGRLQRAGARPDATRAP
jgi:hypothetical protein